MRLDYLTIFPDYLAPLRLSLPGKAVEAGLLELHVHDLRAWAHDRHRTVDDTPYGGGAGMVLKPEPFGEALDELAVDGATVVVPTPAGRPFTQAVARDLATRERLVFLCGRYEGIDQRVLDHVAGRAELVEVSLGDYVLNGGEVAALAVTEAVVRLLPGFMGNAASLVEESHEAGLLEHPVFTKPASWRGHEVPPVLLSGDHGAIAAWRRAQAVRRTAERRPDLLAAAGAAEPGEWEVRAAVPADAGELLTLRRACRLPDGDGGDAQGATTWVVRSHGRLVGAVRTRGDGDAWAVDLLAVAPDLRDRGLEAALLAAAERAAGGDAASYRLLLGADQDPADPEWRRAGYRPGRDGVPTKRIRRR